MSPKTIPEDIIVKFCTKLLPEFRKIMINLEELCQESSPDTFAMNLMELGRGQMSEIADPTEKDVAFMSDYIKSLKFDDTEGNYFAVYAGGCILGLVLINQLPSEDFSTALCFVEEFAQREFEKGI